MAYGMMSAIADATKSFAIDLIDGVGIFSRGKFTWGPENVANEVTSAAGLPIALDTPAAAAIGALTEAAPGTDTASSGLNGRLQRIAQRLTTLITAIGTPLQAGGSVGITGSVTVTGPLTDAQLRTTAVPVAFANGQFGTATATIASGANTSATVDLGTNRLFGIVMPTAWTAADIAFQASIDGTTFFDVFTDDSARLYVFTDGYTTGGRFIPLINPSIFLAIRYLRIVSRTTSSTVNQAALRDVTLVTMP